MPTHALRTLFALTITLGFAATLPAQTADIQATLNAFNDAHREYDARNFTVAAQKYRDFLTRHPNDGLAPSARLGLARCLVDGPSRDFGGAAEVLKAVEDKKDLTDRQFLPYYNGLIQRGLGMKELAQGRAKPSDASKHQEAAQKLFTEAAKQFGLASEAFAALPPTADPKGLAPELEMAVLSRCDQAEMLLMADKAKEARTIVDKVLKDDTLTKSRHHGLIRYYHGWACFALEDFNAAGRSLSLLAPFADPKYSGHARYLLGRVYHIGDERAEASVAYEGVLADYEKQKKDASRLLQLPEIKKNPAERARLEALSKEPPPEYVARAGYYLGVLHFEGGRFADAQARFAAFIKQFPQSPLVPAAQLRLGAAQVEARQFPDAVQTLRPLVEKEPGLSDQTLYWLAKAWTGQIDPKNPKGTMPAAQNAMEAQRNAADKARAKAATDPEAKARLGQILLDRVDILLLIGQPREAVVTLKLIVSDQLLPERRQDEVEHRMAAALNLAGDYAESDKVCERFLKDHARSPLLPVVLFRHAENSAFLYLTAEREGGKDLPKLNEEVEKLFRQLLDKYPEFEHTGRARFGLALCLYRKGQVEKAKEMLESIPASDHVDDLAVVPYLLTDWLIRLTPMKAEDALQAAKAQEQLTTAVGLLQTFVDAQPKGPLTPDALIKLGICKQRLALLAAQPQERNNMLGSAGRRFDRLISTFPRDERVPQARLEKARCRELAGDVTGAIGDLQRFGNDPILKQSPVAPVAALHLATLLRSQSKPADAAAVLGQCRQDLEAALLKDPARVGWAAQMQCQQGVCLKEASKLAEARAVLEGVIKQFPDRPEAADARLRLGQCLKEEALAKTARARQVLATPTAKAEEIAAALKLLENDTKDLRAAVDYLQQQADALKKKQPESEARARMLYEAAWSARALAEIENAVARNKIVREGRKEGQPIPPLSEAPADKVGIPAAEKQARTLYRALIADFSDLPLANDARLELSELVIARGEFDAAIKVLDEALDKEPAQELTDKLRLQLGLCRAEKGNVAGAMEQFNPLLKNSKSPAFGQAHLWAGEALMRAGDAGAAAKHLSAFREQQALRNVPGVTDRGLLRLGQALAQLKQWEPSRQAYERLVNELGNSPLVAEARYGMGWARQQQKDYDNAVNEYQRAAESPTRAGAFAQLQAGLCRLEQKRYKDAASALEAVATRFTYPELSAVALLEAARALAENKQRDEADKLLQQVLRDHPKGTWADAAREQQKVLKDGATLKRPAALDEVLVLDVKKPRALPELGIAAADRPSADDNTIEMSLAVALASAPTGSKTPVPYIRVTLPDPFEYRVTNRTEAAEVKNPAAGMAAWPAGS